MQQKKCMADEKGIAFLKENACSRPLKLKNQVQRQLKYSSASVLLKLQLESEVQDQHEQWLYPPSKTVSLYSCSGRNVMRATRRWKKELHWVKLSLLIKLRVNCNLAHVNYRLVTVIQAGLHNNQSPLCFITLSIMNHWYLK